MGHMDPDFRAVRNNASMTYSSFGKELMFAWNDICWDVINDLALNLLYAQMTSTNFMQFWWAASEIFYPKYGTVLMGKFQHFSGDRSENVK